jgi:hypothetical protein
MSNLDVIATERARTMLRLLAEQQRKTAGGPLGDRADALALSHLRSAERLEQLLAGADRVWADADALEALRGNAAVDPETEACNTREASRVRS